MGFSIFLISILIIQFQYKCALFGTLFLFLYLGHRLNVINLLSNYYVILFDAF